VAGTLVLSAWEPELAPLRQIARAGKRSRVVWNGVAVGVGAVDAGIGAARAIARHRPTRVIFVGTAGAYRSVRGAPAIGAVVSARELLAVSTAALRGDGYLPAPQVVREAAAPALRAAIQAGAAGPPAEVAVACPVAITRTARLAGKIARGTGAAVENLEAFAVARAAAAAGLPFAALLGIANDVGPSAHHQWRDNHRSASRAACEAVAEFLGVHGTKKKPL
jgi:nucleoside phosphorylase